MNRQGTDRSSLSSRDVFANLTVKAWNDASFAHELRANPEKVISAFAAEMGVDAKELKTKNFILPERPVGDLPFSTETKPGYKLGGQQWTLTSECGCPNTVTGGCSCFSLAGTPCSC